MISKTLMLAVQTLLKRTAKDRPTAAEAFFFAPKNLHRTASCYSYGTMAGSCSNHYSCARVFFEATKGVTAWVCGGEGGDTSWASWYWANASCLPQLFFCHFNASKTWAQVFSLFPFSRQECSQSQEAYAAIAAKAQFHCLPGAI